jgi:hypothetical protein
MGRIRDDRGAALIVAMAVTFVVMVLSTVVVSQAIHNTGSSAYDRRRLTSVNGAEAGLNTYYNYLETTEGGELSTAAMVDIAVAGAPGTTTFTITPTFFADEEGTLPFTGTPSDNNFPGSVRLLSVGETNDGTERTMESFVILSPVYGGLTGAIVTNSNTTFSNNFTINGNNGNDGDLYVLNGNFTAPSGIETIKGDIYVTAGTATIGTNLHLYGEVWANGAVSVNHPQALVDIDARSTTAGVAVTSGTVKGSAYYCTGAAPGANVQGQKIQTCALGAPPTEPFPQIQFLQSAWESAGYFVKFFTGVGSTPCTNAQTYVEGTTSGTFQGGSDPALSGYGGVVVYIDAACAYGNSNNSTVTLGKNLAILTEGSINLANRSNWNGSGGTKQLYFMAPWPGGSPCNQNITVGNNNNFNSLVETFVYSPCTVTMNNNNSAFQGQVIGQTVNVGNLFNMTYKPILVPGAEIVGFEQDIAYIREVQ